MGIRFSNKPVAYRSIRADTSANLRGDLDLALLAVGWVHTSTLTNGFIYLITSPESLSCKCRIQDTGGSELGGNPYVEVQFMSADELRQGIIHHLIYNNNPNRGAYQMIAGICQMFLSLPNKFLDFVVGDGRRSYAVCGGVPAMPQLHGSTCINPGAPNHTEAWWSNGVDPTGQQAMRGGRHCYGNYSICVNGALLNQTTTNSYPDFPLQLIALTPTDNIDFWAFVPARVIKYGSNQPMYLDAHIGYGVGMVGQLWDAFQVSRDTAPEDIKTSTEIGVDGTEYIAHWLAYNYSLAFDLKGGGGTYYGTLYVLKDTTPDIGSSGGGGADSNYVY